VTPAQPAEASESHLHPRVLGRVRGENDGPTLIAIGGLHGNEPAGVQGIERVMKDLVPGDVEIRGDFVGLTGNRSALARGRRYVDIDMNRIWSEGETRKALQEVAESPTRTITDPIELRERQELRDALAETAAAARGPVFVMDLHTTSGPGGGFTAIGDTLPNRAFARAIPVPLVLGLEELVDGTLLEYLDEHGYVSTVYETGQHGESAAVYRAEAGIWLALAHAGLVDARSTPRVRAAYQYLRKETRELPEVVEMQYRHHVMPDDGFAMREGYQNFQRIYEGEPLADSEAGAIRAPSDARILMPLYQEQGDDGFFVVREFHTFWLRVSALLRRLRVGRLLPLLPGVRFHEGRRHIVEIDRRVARFYALQFFHLLGYRKQREDGGRLFMIRRAYDVGD
jgi:succinylglutamate desuccinylase